jgi:hypothetical protein
MEPELLELISEIDLLFEGTSTVDMGISLTNSQIDTQITLTSNVDLTLEVESRLDLEEV